MSDQGKTYIFGYGSLLSPRCITRTLKNRTYTREELIPARLPGYSKAWSALSRNRFGAADLAGIQSSYVAFLNLEPQPNAQALGVLIDITADVESCLKAMNERERSYSCIQVGTEVEVLSSNQSWLNLKGDAVYTYRSTPPLPRPIWQPKTGICEPYYLLVKDACERLGESYLWELQKLMEENKLPLLQIKDPQVLQQFSL